jgi:tripartite-type tricarboxylate transporter receptor subunit TctC
MFSSRAGIRLLDVQYKGAAPAVVDLVGGHVMMRFDQVTTSLLHIRENKLRALAVTTLKRSSVLPAVPTISESGLPGFSDSTSTASSRRGHTAGSHRAPARRDRESGRRERSARDASPLKASS